MIHSSPGKVRQGNRVVLRNVVMPVRDDRMPGMVGPTIERSGARWSFSREDDSRAAGGRASSSRGRDHERERSRERAPPPPPTLPPFMDMAPLEPLSRDQRYYRYVQCPVLCLDSNSFYERSHCLWFVFCDFVFCNFRQAVSTFFTIMEWLCCCELRTEILRDYHISREVANQLGICYSKWEQACFMWLG